MIRLRMTVHLADALPLTDDGLSPSHVSANVREGLAELLFSAYEGGPDQEEDTVSEAEVEIDRTLGGGYGPLIPEASFVVRDELGPIACTFVVLHRELPLLAHALVHPRARGRRLGEALIRRSMDALGTLGHAELTLAVNPESRARRVYERLGFVTTALPTSPSVSG